MAGSWLRQSLWDARQSNSIDRACSSRILNCPDKPSVEKSTKLKTSCTAEKMIRMHCNLMADQCTCGYPTTPNHYPVFLQGFPHLAAALLSQVILRHFLPGVGEGVGMGMGEAVGVVGYNLQKSVHWNPDVMWNNENRNPKTTTYDTYPEERHDFDQGIQWIVKCVRTFNNAHGTTIKAPTPSLPKEPHPKS